MAYLIRHASMLCGILFLSQRSKNITELESAWRRAKTADVSGMSQRYIILTECNIINILVYMDEG